MRLQSCMGVMDCHSKGDVLGPPDKVKSDTDSENPFLEDF